MFADRLALNPNCASSWFEPDIVLAHQMSSRAHIATQPRPSFGAGLSVISSSLVLAALPIFMVGGLAVQIRSDLRLTESALGAAVTTGFLVGSISAPIGGKLADRIGPFKGMFLGATLASLALVGLATIVSGWWSLTLVLAVAGLSVAITDPGLAILVGRIIQPDRQGLAFGVKEASIPTATLVAGLAVPAIALTVGWRWAFSLGLVPLLVIAIVLPRIREAAPRSTPDEEEISPGTAKSSGSLLPVAVAAALGTASASGIGVFLTESAVAMGSSEAAAGIILAVGSVAGIITRVAVGVRADRTGGVQFSLIATMMAGGAATMALGGTGNVALLVLGTIGAFTGGWAWTGIFFLSLVKLNPAAPGAAAGVGTASLGAGNASGPLLFGLAAQTWSFPVAWALAAGVAGLAALIMFRASTRH